MVANHVAAGKTIEQHVAERFVFFFFLATRFALDVKGSSVRGWSILAALGPSRMLTGIFAIFGIRDPSLA